MIAAADAFWRALTRMEVVVGQALTIIRTLAVRGYRAERELTDEEVARVVADVVGPDSSAARAIADLDDRRARGIDAELRADGLGQWVVASRAPTEDPRA